MPLDRRALLTALAALPLTGRARAQGRDPLSGLASPNEPDSVLGFGVIARDGTGRAVLEEVRGSSRLSINGVLQARGFALNRPCASPRSPSWSP